MSVQNNKFFSCLLQLIAISTLVLSFTFLCSTLWSKSGITVKVGSTRPTPVFAPTATPDPYHIILLEQAKANAKVQVIYAEAEAQSKRTWDAAIVGIIFFTLIIIARFAWLKWGSYGE